MFWIEFLDLGNVESFEADFFEDSRLCGRQQTLWETADSVVDSRLCGRQQTLWKTADSVEDSRLCRRQQTLWKTADSVVDSRLSTNRLSTLLKTLVVYLSHFTVLYSFCAQNIIHPPMNSQFLRHKPQSHLLSLFSTLPNHSP
jgi:hypothetical protein